MRAYGFREVASGILTLSVEKEAGLWSRVAGDGLDIATLLAHLRDDNPKKGNVAMGLMMVAGITLLDIATANGARVRHSRQRGSKRMYHDRTGFPKGLAASRGIAARHNGRPQLAASNYT